MKKKDSRLIVGSGLLGSSLLLLVAAKFWPKFSEKYARGVYPIYRKLLGSLFGSLSFSVAELLLYLLILLGIASFLRAVYQKIHSKQKATLLGWLRGGYLLLAGLFFSYTIGCGINYQQPSFVQQVGLRQKNYSTKELAATCSWLTKKINQLNQKIDRDDQQVVNPGDFRQIAPQVMQQAGKTYLPLEGDYPVVKTLVFSELLSYQQLTGIFAPFTIEANVNGQMPNYLQYFTACHELAHLQGFMSEAEANLIGFLACHQSDLPEVQYSGYLNAWEYTMRALKKADAKSYQKLFQELAPQVKEELASSDRFWQQYAGFFSQLNTQVNDYYLKAQGQEKGVGSYGAVCDLVVNYYWQEIHSQT